MRLVHPPVGQLRDVVLVGASKAAYSLHTLREPLRIAPLRFVFLELELPDDFHRGEWTGRAPDDLLALGVAVSIDFRVEVRWRTHMPVARTHAHPPDPPGTGSFLDARQLGSPLKVPRALPPVLPVVFMGDALFYLPVVLDGSAPEDVRIVSGY